MIENASAPRPRRAGGFSLLEVLAVLGIVTLVAGVVAPALRFEIDDAKVDRARNDVTAIAKAILNVRNTTGQWPAMDGRGNANRVTALVSGPTKPNANPWRGSAGYWRRVRSATCDLLANHLVANRPFAQNTNTYAATGANAWRGPYLDIAGLDPWGRPYYVNIQAAYSTNARQQRRLWVLSAGPDGRFQTSPTAGTGDDLQGDDIGFLLSQR